LIKIATKTITQVDRNRKWDWDLCINYEPQITLSKQEKWYLSIFLFLATCNHRTNTLVNKWLQNYHSADWKNLTIYEVCHCYIFKIISKVAMPFKPNSMLSCQLVKFRHAAIWTRCHLPQAVNIKKKKKYLDIFEHFIIKNYKSFWNK